MTRRLAAGLALVGLVTLFLAPVVWATTKGSEQWWHKLGGYTSGVVHDLTSIDLAVATSSTTKELSQCRQLHADAAKLLNSPLMPGHTSAWRVVLQDMSSTSSTCIDDVKGQSGVALKIINTTQRELGLVYQLVTKSKLSFKGTKPLHAPLSASPNVVHGTTTTALPGTTTTISPPPPTTTAVTAPPVNVASLFVGTWLGPYLGSLGSCGPNGYTLDTFNANGTYVTTYGTSSCSTFSISGTYQVQGSELYVNEQSTTCGDCTLSSFTVPFSFSNDGNTLDINGYDFTRQ